MDFSQECFDVLHSFGLSFVWGHEATVRRTAVPHVHVPRSLPWNSVTPLSPSTSIFSDFSGDHEFNGILS